MSGWNCKQVGQGTEVYQVLTLGPPPGTFHLLRVPSQGRQHQNDPLVWVHVRLPQVDAGRIFVAPKVEVGYLEQTAVSGSERTVWEEARSRMTALIAAEMAMEHAANAAEQGV